MSAQIVPINPDAEVSGSLTIRSMDDLSRMSGMLAKSGFFADCREAAQAGVKVLAGLELGIPAFSAMTGIHIIKGKPAIGANLMAASVRKSGKYDYEEFEHSDSACRIAFYEAEFKSDIRQLKRQLLKGEVSREEFENRVTAVSLGVSEFTADDARKAGTQNMDRYPKNMLFARAMSNGVKWFCPDIFLGPIYTPDELGASVDDEGNVIDVSPIATQAHAEPRQSEAVMPPLATDAQVKKIWAEAMTSGWRTKNDATLLRMVLSEYGCFDSEGSPSVKAIPKDKVDKILNVLKSPQEFALYQERIKLQSSSVEVEVVPVETEQTEQESLPLIAQTQEEDF